MSEYDKWRSDTPGRYEDACCPECGTPTVPDESMPHGLRPADDEADGCAFCMPLVWCLACSYKAGVAIYHDAPVCQVPKKEGKQ